MALIPFNGDSVQLYEQQLQYGHGIAMYKGSMLQSGEGIFNWLPFLSRIGPSFMGAVRSLIPAAKTVASDALKGAATAAVTLGTNMLNDAINDSPTLQEVPGLTEAASNIIEKVQKRAIDAVGQPQRRKRITRRLAPTVLD